MLCNKSNPGRRRAAFHLCSASAGRASIAPLAPRCTSAAPRWFPDVVSNRTTLLRGSAPKQEAAPHTQHGLSHALRSQPGFLGSPDLASSTRAAAFRCQLDQGVKFLGRSHLFNPQSHGFGAEVIGMLLPSSEGLASAPSQALTGPSCPASGRFLVGEIRARASHFYCSASAPLGAIHQVSQDVTEFDLKQPLAQKTIPLLWEILVRDIKKDVGGCIGS